MCTKSSAVQVLRANKVSVVAILKSPCHRERSVAISYFLTLRHREHRDCIRRTGSRLFAPTFRVFRASRILRPLSFVSRTVGKSAPNLLKRDFRAAKPYSKWTTDITEFRLKGQKLYLSPILDLFNGEIISYTLSSNASFHQVTEMLQNAFKKVPDNVHLILHSDQGWQYQMRQYQKMLKERGSSRACPGRGIVTTTV